jgi:hypothetical protein
MYQSNKAVFQALKSIDTSTFSGSYQVVGAALTYPARIIVMVNQSDRAVTVSFDGGSTDHAYFAASNTTPQVFNFGDNRGHAANALDLPQGTQIMAKGTAGGTGLFTVSVVSAINPTTQVPQ